MRYLGAITNDYDLVTKKYVDDATEVIQTLTSGTKIGSVGGTDLYAPSGGGGGSGTITSVKTTAGAHSTINVTSGAANFNVPTKTSHLTNDSGFLTAETDPIFTASVASDISYSDIDNWNNKLTGSAGTSGTIGITLGQWKIRWGTVTMNSNSASGSGTFTAPYYVDATVNCSFSADPFVWCNLEGTATGTRRFEPHTVTSTSFKIRMYSSRKNTTNFTCRWLAIGKA